MDVEMDKASMLLMSTNDTFGSGRQVKESAEHYGLVGMELGATLDSHHVVLTHKHLLVEGAERAYCALPFYTAVRIPRPFLKSITQPIR